MVKLSVWRYRLCHLQRRSQIGLVYKTMNLIFFHKANVDKNNPERDFKENN